MAFDAQGRSGSAVNTNRHCVDKISNPQPRDLLADCPRSDQAGLDLPQTWRTPENLAVVHLGLNGTVNWCFIAHSQAKETSLHFNRIHVANPATRGGFEVKALINSCANRNALATARVLNLQGRCLQFAVSGRPPDLADLNWHSTVDELCLNSQFEHLSASYLPNQ